MEPNKELSLTLNSDALATLAAAGVIPHDTPPAMVEVFARCAAEHNLSPFKKEIHLVRRMTKNGPAWMVIVGIDGLRGKAGRTGEYAGKDDIRYNLKSDGSYATAGDIINDKIPLVSATCTVYRFVHGQRVGFTHTVLYKEYAPPPGKNSGWDNMPVHMLGKCAEAGALRQGFSGETAGLYIPEEQAAFEEATIAATEANPAKSIDRDELQKKITACKTVKALGDLWQSSSLYAEFADMFTERKNELIEEREAKKSAAQ